MADYNEFSVTWLLLRWQPNCCPITEKYIFRNFNTEAFFIECSNDQKKFTWKTYWETLSSENIGEHHSQMKTDYYCPTSG